MSSQMYIDNLSVSQCLRKLSRRIGLHSIQGRLTSIAVLFILGTSITIGIVGFRFAVNFERHRFGEHFDLLATNLAGNAELGVVLGNEKMLQRLTDNMLSVRDVHLVEIISSSGKLIIRRASADAIDQLGYATAPVIAQNFDATNSIFLDNPMAEKELGTVRIGYSLAAIEQLKQQLAFGFVVISVIFGVISLFFYWRLSRAIRAPLSGVLKVAGQVSQGQMDVRADGGTLQETVTLARAFNDMLDALQQQRREIKQANELAAQQQILAEVGKFSLTVAHEIKNPLAIINGSLEILRKDDPLKPELKKRMIGFIDDEIVRMNRLIENFLLFARPQPSILQPITVENLSKQLIQHINLLDGSIGIITSVDADDLKIELQCDVSQFERALFNVIRNAIEVSTSSSQVSVEICSDASHIKFKVCDQGSGVDLGQVQQMFTPFFTTKARGTGLGLAITHEIIKAHNGTIQVSNNQAGGACFTLSVPTALGSTCD